MFILFLFCPGIEVVYRVQQLKCNILKIAILLTFQSFLQLMHLK